MSQTCGSGTKCQQLWCLVSSIPGGTHFQMQTQYLLMYQMIIKAKPWSLYSLCTCLLMLSREADMQTRGNNFHIRVFCWDSLFTAATLRCLFPYLRRKNQSIWIARSLTAHRPWQLFGNCSVIGDYSYSSKLLLGLQLFLPVYHYYLLLRSKLQMMPLGSVPWSNFQPLNHP